MERVDFLQLIVGLPLVPVTLASGAQAQRILVIGDSVTWGQGLEPHDKIHSVLARMIYQNTGAEPTVLHYAHSGGRIGFEEGAPTPSVAVPDWWPREIPRANPTLHEQCAQVEYDHPDQHFDLILVSGGINDVDVTKIFNPKTSIADIQARSAKYCRDSMSTLLDELANRYVSRNPNVKVLVLGYYAVLSDQSKTPNILDVAMALARETISPPKPEVSTLALYKDDVRGSIISNSQAFRDASTADLQSAVAAANAKVTTRNFIFVDPRITDDEAAFAPNALIWGLTSGSEIAQDPVYDDRIRYCKDLLHYKRGVQQFTCFRASVGHPNVNGAIRYAAKVYAAATGATNASQA